MEVSIETSMMYCIQKFGEDFAKFCGLLRIPYARHYKPRLVIFFTQFSLQLRLILQTIYVLKTEILHFLSLKSAAYKRERLQIESGLWWRAYGIFVVEPLVYSALLFFNETVITKTQGLAVAIAKRKEKIYKLSQVNV